MEYKHQVHETDISFNTDQKKTKTKTQKRVRAHQVTSPKFMKHLYSEGQSIRPGPLL